MTIENGDSNTFESEDLLTNDIELEESEPLIEDDDLPKSRTRKVDSERFIDDKFNKTLDATQIYLNEIGFSPLLTAEEEVYFARKALKGDAAARKRMIESNLRLVVKI